MTTTAYTTYGSELQIDISSTYTKIPGMTNVDLDPGENITVSKGDLTSDFDEKLGTGVQEGGTITGELIWDPLDDVHQTIHGAFNTNSELAGKFKVGATGVLIPFTATVKKFPIKAAMKDAFRIDLEFELTDRVTLNTTDP
jgi:hypothetical protein